MWAALAVLIAWGLKRHYADAPVDDLRWILDPTTRLAALATGARFEWIPAEGYLSRERLFLIAKVCAGINFMIAAFGMTAWMLRARAVSWPSVARVLGTSLAAAYLAAVVVNAVRIILAMRLANEAGPLRWISPAQLHRVEGIVVYFGGLVLLFELVRRVERRPGGLATPLISYYVVAVAIPLANGAAAGGSPFWEHVLFVLVIPMLLVALAAASSVLYALRSRSPRWIESGPSQSVCPRWSASHAAQVRWPRLRPHNLRR